MHNPNCHHCGIEIEPTYDQAFDAVIQGEEVVLCDSCHNDYVLFGEDCGDAFRGGCRHREWAAQEVDIRHRVAQCIA